MIVIDLLALQQTIAAVTRQQVRLRSFLHSILCVQHDEKAAAAAADAAACGIFRAASLAPLQPPSFPSSSSPSSSASSSFTPSQLPSSESVLLQPTSVSSVHALSLFCVVACQVFHECFPPVEQLKLSACLKTSNYLPSAAHCRPPFGVVLQVDSHTLLRLIVCAFPAQIDE